jgi:hypothetical protein
MKSEVLLCRSQVLARLKNFQRALDDAEARVRLRPASPRSFECKAAALFGLNRKWEVYSVTPLPPALLVQEYKY